MGDISTLKVGFNAVGGESANDIARALPHGTTMVTYGGMSNRPIEIAQETLNYKQLKMKGFWISQWTVDNSAEDRADMLEDIAGTSHTGCVLCLLLMCWGDHAVSSHIVIIVFSQAGFARSSCVIS